MNTLRWLTRLIVAITGVVVISIPMALADDSQQPVHFIGVSYEGKAGSIRSRFPNTTAVDGFDTKTPSRMTQKLWTAFDSTPPKNFVLSKDLITHPEQQDQVIDLTLMISKENVLQATYKVDGQFLYKLLTQVRAQALYFDVVKSALVRDVPLSFTYIDTLDHPFSQEEIQQRVKITLFGNKGVAGLVGKFTDNVVNAPYPKESAMDFLAVNKVTVSDNARTVLGIPDEAALNDTQNWIADTFAESMANENGVSFIPYAGNAYLIKRIIPLSMSNGDSFNVNLPDADFLFDLDLVKVKEVLFSQSSIGKSMVYGAFFNIQLNAPGDVPYRNDDNSIKYINGVFKNGVVVKIPSTQTDDHQNDLFAYNDSIRGLFENLAEAIHSGSNDWLSKATDASNIKTQIQQTKDEVFKKCIPFGAQ